MTGPRLTYRDAGVDIDEADRLVEQIGTIAKTTHRPEVLEGIGGFAALFSMGFAKGMEEPVLVSGTDGVGTKLEIAFALGIHDTVGIDLVAMCVNDILTTGASPLFFLDYFGTGHLEADVGAAVIRGIAEGCRRSGCALVGGETAELPGMYQDGEYDLAGFAVGIVDRPKILNGARDVRVGDVVVGALSTGLHSNGYSLARKALLEVARLPLDRPADGLSRTLGEELLEPTAIYRAEVGALIASNVRAIAHITGGGILENLPRVMPQGVVAEIDRSAWTVPRIFGLIQESGGVEDREMYRTFNMGMGLVAILPEASAAEAVRRLGAGAVEIGRIRARSGAEEQVSLGL